MIVYDFVTVGGKIEKCGKGLNIYHATWEGSEGFSFGVASDTFLPISVEKALFVCVQ